MGISRPLLSFTVGAAMMQIVERIGEDCEMRSLEHACFIRKPTRSADRLPVRKGGGRWSRAYDESKRESSGVLVS